MTLENEPDPLRRIPTKHTADLRAKIGSILSAARIKRGQSLETVAQQTRISKRFLEALENDRFEEFPAIVYLRGFLKSYCEYLDVDFEQVWSQIDQARTQSPESAAQPRDAASPPASSGNGVSSPAKAPPADPHSAGAHRAPAARAADAPVQSSSGAAGAIMLAAGLALALIFWLLREQGRGPAAHVAVAPVALQPMPHAVEPRLVIRLKNDAWLRVSLDGRKVFEGRVPRGAAQEWKPVKFVGLHTTEPAALELDLNGAPLPLGAPGPDGEYRVEIP